MNEGLRSQVPGIVWPALPAAGERTALALLWQLDRSQWWSAAELAAAQRRQLDVLVAHAKATVPQYAGLGDARDWARVPILSRDDVIAAGPALRSRAYPPSHGPVEEIATSRSTGGQVRVLASAATSTFWRALTARDHLWHRRDLRAHLAAIRFTDGKVRGPDGITARGWGPATAPLAPDAPLSVLDITTTTDEQLAWLSRARADYLLVYPSALAALLDRLEATGARLPTLREVRTIGEALPPELRARCRAVLGVRLVDTYSAQEVGYIALECPSGPRYHVQAESLLVEILDEAGRACARGETGRVVVTDLHNFATPLVRYDLGDYATVGAPCPCGRGLPTLDRIIGRRRGMLRYPDGRTVWPVFSGACRRVARYRELQLVQPSIDAIRARIVPDGPFSDADRAAIAGAIRASFAHPFAVEVEVVDALSKSPAGKLEEFVSQVA